MREISLSSCKGTVYLSNPVDIFNPTQSHEPLQIFHFRIYSLVVALVPHTTNAMASSGPDTPGIPRPNQLVALVFESWDSPYPFINPPRTQVIHSNNN